MTKDYKNKSVGSILANKITDLAHSLNKTDILNEINIYGVSDKDGSATLSFEWLGQNNLKFANEILDFLNKAKSMICETGYEAKEQVEPSITNLSGAHRVLYRFRIWPEKGTYEDYTRVVVNV